LGCPRKAIVAIIRKKRVVKIKSYIVKLLKLKGVFVRLWPHNWILNAFLLDAECRKKG
jgi:hypothetical protein